MPLGRADLADKFRESGPTSPDVRPALHVGPDGWLEALAPAKLNLALHVGPVGPDGYHPLDSVVAKIDWYDTLRLRPRDDGQVTLRCDAPQAGPVEQNLAMRAARALQARAPGRGAEIVLEKSIPVGAGLGGGSSDAAATLAALNELWGLALPRQELAAIGATLGADVPLFFGPAAARMTGRGEVVRPLAVRPFSAVVTAPPVHSSTAAVYRAFDRAAPATLAAADASSLADRPPTQWGGVLRNDLQGPACRLYPQIAAWADRLAHATGRAAHMTGSGSALFVLADDDREAAELFGRLDEELASRSRCVRTNPW